MVATTLSVVRYDSKDLYNKFKIPILAVFAIYLAFVTFNPHTVSKDMKSTAKDILEMDLIQPMPPLLLRTHFVAAMLLLVLCMVQKELVTWMFSDTGKRANNIFFAHKWIGFVTLATLTIMDSSAYLMHRYSAFKDFDIFIIYFAAPWVVFLFGIYFTASRTLIKWHRFFGNCLFKACLTTPLSRIAGAILQRNGWPTEDGFYQGILFFTMVSSTTIIYDLVWTVFFADKEETTTTSNLKSKKL